MANILAKICAAALAVLLLYIVVLTAMTPGIKTLRRVQTAEPSVMLFTDGSHLASFTQTRQDRVELREVSPHVIEALLATEDHRFFEHNGVDYLRTVSAIGHTLRGDTQGGSTITQQLARNLFPDEIGRSRSVQRKLKELITALKIEHAYTKEQILETYLNTVPFMFNIAGIEIAARTYYDKPAAKLNVLESATLIGMLKGTRYYNPLLHPDRAQARRNIVLAQMMKHNLLSAEEYQKLRATPLKLGLKRAPEPFGPAPHFAAEVRRALIAWADENDYNLYTDGLVVHTTLDRRLQQAATQAVQRQAEALQAVADVEWSRPAVRVQSGAPEAYLKLRQRVEPFRHFWQQRDRIDPLIRDTPEYQAALSGPPTPLADAAALQKLKTDAKFMARLRAGKSRLEAGFVAMDPASGEVKAWVGSRDFQQDQFDHVIQAARQPGSTFKPIVYGAALERGFNPERVYYDAPVDIRLADGKLWRPTDMTASTGAPMTLRDGLIYSKNVITAQVMGDIGVPSIVTLAQALGINHSKLDPVPSLALGTSPVTLLEMVSAYATIAQRGEYRQPVFIKRITDRNGTLLAEFSTRGNRAMSQDSALELIDMMRGVVNRGTGTAVKTRFGISADIAGKTGTTQNNTDGWFILMHPQLVAGAWVGFNDARVTMRSDYWGQGGHNALFIVGDFFRTTLAARLIDSRAQFPTPPRSEPAPAEEESPFWDIFRIFRREPERVVGETPAREIRIERTDPTPPRSAEEMGEVMKGMGRDPVTGVQNEIVIRRSAPERPVLD